MRYVYFTKTLQKLDVPGLLRFFTETGLDGADLAVRPGYAINPDNVRAELPRAAQAFKDAGKQIGMVTAPTDMVDAASPVALALFEACGKAGVPAIKIGYFQYRGKFDDSLADARQRLQAFAALAARTGVKACYHTHSGSYMGSNGGTLRMMLQDLDPHHVGAFLDTGHLAVGGAPLRLEFDIVRPWVTLVAIKDMVWEKGPRGWSHHVVPAGTGIVRWNEFGQALKECKFNGTISLHGEYEAKDLAERQAAAQKELEFLKGVVGQTG